MGRVKRIWYLSPMRAAKVQVRLRIRAVSPEPPLLAHTSSESRGTFRQKARSLDPQNGCACAVKICHDGMLEDTNSLDAAQIVCNRMLNRQKMQVSELVDSVYQNAPCTKLPPSLVIWYTFVKTGYGGIFRSNTENLPDSLRKTCFPSYNA